MLSEGIAFAFANLSSAASAADRPQMPFSLGLFVGFHENSSRRACSLRNFLARSVVVVRNPSPVPNITGSGSLLTRCRVPSSS
jgi:hypothetical protein